MAGTIIITGANGSIAVHAVQQLLSKAPDSTLILTVRNISATDPNTRRLGEAVNQFPKSNVVIRRLDLANLKDVHKFAETIAAEVAQEKLPPLAAIICNAFHWNMIAAPELTEDGREKTMQVNHVSHAALILRLLGSFGPRGGRLVLFTSDCHYPGRNSLEVYPPGLPDDLDGLIRADPDTDKRGRGFQNYANSKLAILMWTYALNRYLERDEQFNKISAVAIDPGSIADSRALRTNTPATLSHTQRFVLQPLWPMLRLIMPNLRPSIDAGADIADIALNRTHAGERGYLNLMMPGPSSEESLNSIKQQKIWVKTAEWAGITRENTALQGGFQSHCPY
ncbi:hypothetical protein F5B22DRAFT_104841 [Xylaria bambusicola]|uniref:uncharacterized protein n=1 Tax=Xylaria bambusicola TaxID=326684 RepID=UPI002008AAAF|nr:uncharacterized protein F5B22DRAFT_104841 [Xylaria bambusicola]KAI0517436.1 hypothetical protein F5B22DRAFT_104841 [Xylaria bambusicola]